MPNETNNSVKTICVYCGSGSGSGDRYMAAARELSTEIARRNFSIVYGGARVGLMGELADTALSLGVSVTGVIPDGLVEREIAHEGLTRQHVVASMHERKKKMAMISEGFIALPGGLGTLEELFEIMTWGQLGLHEKPFGILNVHGYYDLLLQFLDHAVKEGFVSADRRKKLVTSESAAELLDHFL